MNLNLSTCELANYLWKDLLERFEPDKAHKAIRQALDLQSMRGDKNTLPVLFVKTGGIALTTYEFLRKETGLHLYGDNKVLLFCPKNKAFQLLHETKQYADTKSNQT